MGAQSEVVRQPEVLDLAHIPPATAGLLGVGVMVMSRNQRKALCVFLGIFLLCVVWRVVFVIDRGALGQRMHCRSQLGAVGAAITMYVVDHDGAFPIDIASFASHYANNPKIYVCPGSKTELGTMTNVDKWMDYIYLYWPEGKATPEHYPLMYDRRLANHGGCGINILLVGAGGNPKREPDMCFWDKNAQWLKKFAEEHPDLKVPLPEDM